MIKGILFDLDGVICDTAKFHYLAWKKTANDLGADIDAEFNESLKGVDRSESLCRLLNHIEVTLTEEEFEATLISKNRYYVSLLSSLTSDDVLPGVYRFIETLRANNIGIAIASASKNAPNILKKIDLMDMVDTIANPDDVVANKPAPDIFLLAAKQLGLEPSQCIGIEDAQAGIDALNSAGIKSIAIGSSLKHASITLSNTTELSITLID